jgi:hypothetical protein
MEINNINDIQNGIESAKQDAIPLKEQAKTQLSQILKLLPTNITDLVEEAFDYQRIPKEYLLSSILFAYSNAVGLAFTMNALGFKNYGNLFFAIIGSRGDVKSLAIDLATDPLNEFDSKSHSEYEKLKRSSEKMEGVHLKELFLQDATVEGAMFAHSNNRFSIGLLMDELFSLIQKMANKNSNEGAMYKTFLLQGYNNKHIKVTRKTTDSYRVDKSYPTLIGSMQKEFVPQLFANGNLESGFIDRILFTPKLTHNNKMSAQSISTEVLDKYAEGLTNLYNYRLQNEEQEGIVSTELKLTESAHLKLMEYVQNLINEQENLGNILFQYNAKMQISIHKLIILVHLIDHTENDDYNSPVTIQTVELAILINEFYLTNFKIIIEENLSHQSLDIILDDIIKYAIKNGKTQKEVVEISNYNKSTVSRHWNKIVEQQLATRNQSNKL